MSEINSQVEATRQRLAEAHEQGTFATLRAYFGLSGPGWLQSALTLGGGSLGSSLYLGILAGTSLLWLQPFAMLLGVIMLSTISYVTLSTGERPFRAINNHINPVLGWSWIIASLMANMVWSMPQYSLCYAVFEQNLFPSWFAEGALFGGGGDAAKWWVSGAILLLCTLVTWSYGSGGWGMKLYDTLLKLVVAMIVCCFFGVVFRMAWTGEGIDWGQVFAGLIPNPRYLFEPVAGLRPLLDTITDPEARRYWSDLIVSEQRDVMLSAGAAAVGINMTFLLPYSLLTRGWGKEFRGLTFFDLSTGMFIPFVLATGCVVIASAQQFHGKLPAGFVVTEQQVEAPEHFQKPYQKMLNRRVEASSKERYTLDKEPTLNEKQVAAVLVRRDTFDLAKSLENLFGSEGSSSGSWVANVVFGIGVVGMTLSSIALMMLISGFVVCEIFDCPATGWTFRIGSLASACGILWPLLWQGDAKTWLTIVAGVYGAMLLPIAYVTFSMMMNRRSILGEEMPTGFKRFIINLLIGFATLAATAAGISAVYKKADLLGLAFVAAYIVLIACFQVKKKPTSV